jgi:uncharacterized membrane protein YedE/YeeE
MNKIISLISGAIFGFGLTASSMTNPAKVLGFLDLFGQWDPSLIFVMIGAIIISSPFFFLLKSKIKPLFAQTFSIPEIKRIDAKLIIGSSLFGIGWGAVGLCPGPAISSLALLNNYSLAFIASMFLGFLLAKVFN